MAGLQPETLMAVLEAALGLPHDAGKVSPFIAIAQLVALG
jgi:hypothetical protein